MKKAGYPLIHRRLVMMGDVQILQGLLADCVSGGFAKIPFLFQGVSDAFFTG